jgi:hypothetical protein
MKRDTESASPDRREWSRVLVAAHRSCDEALDDLIDYRQLYPRSTFELELRNDGRLTPWRVVLKVRRHRPWQRWAFAKRASRQGGLPQDGEPA